MICGKKWEKRKKMFKKNYIKIIPLAHYFHTKLFVEYIIYLEFERLELERLELERLELERLEFERLELEKLELEKLESTQSDFKKIDFEEFKELESGLLKSTEDIEDSTLNTNVQSKIQETIDIKNLLPNSAKYLKYKDFFNQLDWMLVLSEYLGELDRDVSVAGGSLEICSNYFVFSTLVWGRDVLYRLFLLYTNKFIRAKLKYKFTKKRKRKFFLKKKQKNKIKRIFKKKNFFKKYKRFKKIFKHKHFLIKKQYKKYSFIWSMVKKPTIKNSILIQKTPISTKALTKNYVEFFYKFNKNYKKFYPRVLQLTHENYGVLEKNIRTTIYLRNFNQKPYWKLRIARLAHWSLFFSKTIRKRRYKQFITKYMKKYNKLNLVYTFLANYFTNLNISWTRICKLNIFLRYNFIKIINKSIIVLPIVLNKFINWKLLKKKNYKIKKNIGKWSYLKFKKFLYPWLQKKKSTPKQIKHIQPLFLLFKGISSFDCLTNYVWIHDSLIRNSLPITENFKVNWLIKLHMYRYNSNNKCLLL